MLWAVMYVLACAQASTAQDIDGTDDPRFVQAKQDWLAGEDMPALEELAALAHEGHAPAKILLSRIAATPHVIDPVTQTLDRKAKIALLREPVGLSGRDWLVSAAEDNDLAHALWAVAAPGKIAPDAEVARTLIAFGEIKPALIYALALWKAGKGEEAAQILHEHEARFGAAGQDFLGFLLMDLAIGGTVGPLPDGMNTPAKLEAYLHALRSDENRFAYSGTLDTSPLLHPSREGDRERLAQLVHAVPAVRPLVLFCEARCGERQQEMCLAEGAWSLAKAANHPYPFASPAQSLIEDATYWASPRFFSDVEHLLARGDWLGCR